MQSNIDFCHIFIKIKLKAKILEFKFKNKSNMLRKHVKTKKISAFTQREEIMKKIVVIEPGYLEYSSELEVLKEFDPSISVVKLGTVKSEILNEVKDADAILVREAKVDKEIIDAALNCQIIVRYGVGVDNIDLDYAKTKSIKVANVPDYGSEDVAEHALALLLATSRRIPSRNNDVHNGIWGVGQKEVMPRLSGKILGVIGFGRISQCVIKKASGIGFSKIIAFDPMFNEEIGNKLGVTQVSLEELCKTADFISLHAPLLPSTKEIINENTLSLMKENVVLVNTSRGGLVNENDLYQALVENKIFAAGLDVFNQEPIAKDNKLLTLSNVITTDHTAWYTAESVIELQKKAALEIKRVFLNQDPMHWVNQ